MRMSVLSCASSWCGFLKLLLSLSHFSRFFRTILVLSRVRHASDLMAYTKRLALVCFRYGNLSCIMSCCPALLLPPYKIARQSFCVLSRCSLLPRGLNCLIVVPRKAMTMCGVGANSLMYACAFVGVGARPRSCLRVCVRVYMCHVR